MMPALLGSQRETYHFFLVEYFKVLVEEAAFVVVLVVVVEVGL